MDLQRALKNERLLKALTGLNFQEFENLEKPFSETLLLEAKNKKRKRAVGAGIKGVLDSPRLKFFFILFYLKTYPTFDLAGFFFDVDRSRPCRWVQKFLPILEQTLGKRCLLPKRQIRSIEEFLHYFPDAKDFFIDGTERRTQRPKSPKNQKRKYSGKKKTHTRKNIIMTDADKKILLLSASKNGRRHDKNLLDKTCWLSSVPPDTTLWVDTGFQGIQKTVNKGISVMMPKKKSRKKPLTDKQKEENKTISSIRIVVENALAGIKRFNSLHQVYRNRKGQDDSMMMLASGLWNLHLQMK